MAMDKTRYFRKLLLDHALGRNAMAFPTSRFLALFSADPTVDGLLANEIAGGSYARVDIVSLLSDTILETGMSSNAANIVFPMATADWANISHAGLCDASAAGNLLYFGPAVSARVVDSGDTFTIKVGQLVIIER